MRGRRATEAAAHRKASLRHERFVTICPLARQLRRRDNRSTAHDWQQYHAIRSFVGWSGPSRITTSSLLFASSLEGATIALPSPPWQPRRHANPTPPHRESGGSFVRSPCLAVACVSLSSCCLLSNPLQRTGLPSIKPSRIWHRIESTCRRMSCDITFSHFQSRCGIFGSVPPGRRTCRRLLRSGTLRSI
jgi:hypothetical protein